ncbi:GNAT family N-acetyltransferase [Microvirga antarctica]|uniref:GNAT family N-acetyltransferase n=1 Tax=Microvirga antarctica TaxID=2819233 RepID=UPI001B314368|nr:GNAT family N-acetyltransferase [Microvirga antarctica]
MIGWRAMSAADLADVHAIAQRLHGDHPEDVSVARERLALFPAGCRVLVDGSALIGYAVSHPWILGEPPALDTRLGRLPQHPTTYYVHDVAILPAGRGQGAAAAVLAHMMALSRAAGLDNLSLVAVSGSQAVWARLGFVPPAWPGMAGKLASYGEAAFMIRRLDEGVG